MEDVYSSKKKQKESSGPKVSNTNSANFKNGNNPVLNNNQNKYSEYQYNARLAAEREFDDAKNNRTTQSYGNAAHPGDVYASSYRKPNNNAAEAYTENIESHSGKRKKGGIFKKIILSVLSLFLVAAIALGAIVNQLIGSVNYNQTGHKKNAYVNESTLYNDKKVKNILLIGVDRRNDDDKSRSDTMMLLSIDQKNKKIKMTSFLRDSWVDIPGEKHAKLNAACSWGGVQLVMDTLEYNFNIKIDKYVMVDFTMFKNIVNKLGGIDVEITEKEAKYMRDKVHLDVKAGESEHLDGNEALWYCRIRYLDSDFMRTQRQRKVLTAVIAKLKEQSPIELFKIVKDVLPDVETDMSKKDMLVLGTGAVFKYIRYDLEQAQIPKDGTWKNARKNKQAVLEMDINANKEYLYDFLYGEGEIITEEQ